MAEKWTPTLGDLVIAERDAMRNEAQYCRGQVNVDVATLDQVGDLQDCVFGVQVHPDGRVWVCVNGATWLRFKPNGKEIENV